MSGSWPRRMLTSMQGVTYGQREPGGRLYVVPSTSAVRRLRMPVVQVPESSSSDEDAVSAGDDDDDEVWPVRVVLTDSGQYLQVLSDGTIIPIARLNGRWYIVENGTATEVCPYQHLINMLVQEYQPLRQLLPQHASPAAMEDLLTEEDNVAAARRDMQIVHEAIAVPTESTEDAHERWQSNYNRDQEAALTIGMRRGYHSPWETFAVQIGNNWWVVMLPLGSDRWIANPAWMAPSMFVYGTTPDRKCIIRKYGHLTAISENRDRAASLYAQVKPTEISQRMRESFPEDARNARIDLEDPWGR